VTEQEKWEGVWRESTEYPNHIPNILPSQTVLAVLSTIRSLKQLTDGTQDIQPPPPPNTHARKLRSKDRWTKGRRMQADYDNRQHDVHFANM
jgi:hypothetical protein